MAEWITLLLIVPAILIPVALLVGFAACDQVYKLERRVGPAILDSATGTGAVTITVEWVKGNGSQSYVLDRTDPDGITTTSIPISASPFDDTGLQPATTYTYQVRGEDSSGATISTSNSLPGTTLPLVSAYAKTLPDPNANWQRYTLVQRIEAAHLSATGPNVRITLQAAPTNPASIDRAYISQAAAGGKPYDSAGDLTKVYDLADDQQGPFVVTAGTTRQLPLVRYTLTNLQALIIAIDFSATPNSDVGSAIVPASEASAYHLVTPQGEAAVAVRSPNYSGGVDPDMNSFVRLITNIEVG